MWVWITDTFLPCFKVLKVVGSSLDTTSDSIKNVWCACIKDPNLIWHHLSSCLPLLLCMWAVSWAGCFVVISKLTGSDRCLSDKVVTICVCARAHVCVRVRVHARMESGVNYVQCSELYASCVMWLTPVPTSVLVIIQLYMLVKASGAKPCSCLTKPSSSFKSTAQLRTRNLFIK
jgi:hypothetical protein